MLLFLVARNALATVDFALHTLQLNNRSYQIELADNNARRTQGLMYRPVLAHDAGMLFTYQRPGDYRIWMKNTLIPLLVIWLDTDARIIDMQILPPCRMQNCLVYGAPEASQYILELNPAQSSNFAIGDVLASILTLTGTIQ